MHSGLTPAPAGNANTRGTDSLKLIGVISDTHGLLRPQALDALRDTDLIIHAGDIGSPAVIAALEKLGPVYAVRGNVDRDAWAARFPETQVVQVEGLSIYVLHDLGRLDLDPGAAGMRIVIAGHSHQPALTTRRGILYLNPGSAGPQRFQLPISLAKLRVGEGNPQAELIDLSAIA
jgi:putative phosphoesterase